MSCSVLISSAVCCYVPTPVWVDSILILYDTIHTIIYYVVINVITCHAQHVMVVVVMVIPLLIIHQPNLLTHALITVLIRWIYHWIQSSIYLILHCILRVKSGDLLYCTTFKYHIIYILVQWLTVQYIIEWIWYAIDL